MSEQTHHFFEIDEKQYRLAQEGFSSATAQEPELLFEAGKSILILNASVANSNNFTNIDDLTWRKNRFAEAIINSGLVMDDWIQFGSEHFASGHLKGFSLLLIDISKSKAKILCELLGTKGIFYSSKKDRWALIDDRKVLQVLPRLYAYESGVKPFLQVAPELLAPKASLLTPMDLKLGRGEDALYRNGIRGLTEEAQAISSKDGLSWDEVFSEHKPLRLFYMAVSFGARPIIHGRIAASFEKEGFTPKLYQELTHALNGDQLATHERNIFKSTNRVGGGREGMEWVTKPSEFRIFPRLRELGLSPVDAATAILNVTGVQEDLLTEIEQKLKTRGN